MAIKLIKSNTEGLLEFGIFLEEAEGEGFEDVDWFITEKEAIEAAKRLIYGEDGTEIRRLFVVKAIYQSERTK